VSSVNDVLPERPGGGGGDPAAALVVAVCGMLSAIHYTDMCLAHAGCSPPVSFFIARPFPFPSLFLPCSVLFLILFLSLPRVCFRLPQNFAAPVCA